jgi:peptidoglycan/xylan/chitin deacetylase (PgdA/CDA1 family)
MSNTIISSLFLSVTLLCFFNDHQYVHAYEGGAYEDETYEGIAYEGGTFNINMSNISNINISNISDNDDTYSDSYVEAKIYRNCIYPGMIALTYDDGPNIFTEEFIKNVTVNYNVTFFINGWNYENVQESPWHSIIKLAYDSGHEIGNHGWNHWSYTNASGMNGNKLKENLNNTEILLQMTSVNDLIHKIIGKAPTIFRPPYGQYDEKTLRIASIAGLKAMILWSIDSLDWSIADPREVFDYIINIIMSPGVSSENSSFIIDMHEQIVSTELLTTPLLKTVLTNLGYRFVTISECIGIDVYQTNYTPFRDMELFDSSSKLISISNLVIMSMMIVSMLLTYCFS